MHIPKGAIKLSDIQTMQQIRLGIQGSPKTGKSYSATSFPNPIFMNLDRGLGAHTGKENILELQFWDDKFVAGIAPSRKEAIIKWLQTEAKQLEADQTLVLDGSTGLQNAFEHWIARNPQYTKQGKIDDFAPWRLKKEYFGEILELAKTLRCNFLYIAHETEAKDKDGGYSGKLRPLLTGQFGDELSSHMTDWFRQHSAEKPKDYSVLKPESLANWGMTKVEEFKAMCDSFKDCPSIYYWQTYSDDRCDCGSSSLVGFPKFIPATYQSFIKYARKTTISNEGKV